MVVSDVRIFLYKRETTDTTIWKPSFNLPLIELQSNGT